MEHNKQMFGYLKSKGVFSTDEGLAKHQIPFLAAARPIAPALVCLDEPLTEYEEGNLSDSDKVLFGEYLQYWPKRLKMVGVFPPKMEKPPFYSVRLIGS